MTVVVTWKPVFAEALVYVVGHVRHFSRLLVHQLCEFPDFLDVELARGVLLNLVTSAAVVVAFIVIRVAEVLAAQLLRRLREHTTLELVRFLLTFLRL